MRMKMRMNIYKKKNTKKKNMFFDTEFFKSAPVDGVSVFLRTNKVDMTFEEILEVCTAHETHPEFKDSCNYILGWLYDSNKIIPPPLALDNFLDYPITLKEFQALNYYHKSQQNKYALFNGGLICEKIHRRLKATYELDKTEINFLKMNEALAKCKEAYKKSSTLQFMFAKLSLERVALIPQLLFPGIETNPIITTPISALF